jgi:hypothetical protein
MPEYAEAYGAGADVFYYWGLEDCSDVADSLAALDEPDGISLEDLREELDA